MEWFKTSESLPPYGVNVLGWTECDQCRKKESHGHHMIQHSGSTDVYVTYYVKGWKQEDCEDDYWSPYPPHYWCYIKDPITNLLVKD